MAIIAVAMAEVVVSTSRKVSVKAKSHCVFLLETLSGVPAPAPNMAPAT